MRDFNDRAEFDDAGVALPATPASGMPNDERPMTNDPMTAALPALFDHLVIRHSFVIRH
jgi:hypothetical protein